MKFLHRHSRHPISHLCLAIYTTLMTASLHESLAADDDTEAPAAAMVSHHRDHLSSKDLPIELVEQLRNLNDEQMKFALEQAKCKRSERTQKHTSQPFSCDTFDRNNALKELLNPEYTEQDIRPLYPHTEYDTKQLNPDYREFVTNEEACSKLTELKKSGQSLPSSVAIMEPLEPETATALYDIISNLEQFFFCYKSETNEQIFSISTALQGIQMDCISGGSGGSTCSQLWCSKEPFTGESYLSDLGLTMRSFRADCLLVEGKFDRAKELTDSLVGTCEEHSTPLLYVMLYLDHRLTNPYHDLQKGRVIVEQIRDGAEKDDYYFCLARIFNLGLSIRGDDNLCSSYQSKARTIAEQENEKSSAIDQEDLPPIPAFLSRQDIFDATDELAEEIAQKAQEKNSKLEIVVKPTIWEEKDKDGKTKPNYRPIITGSKRNSSENTTQEVHFNQQMLDDRFVDALARCDQLIVQVLKKDD